MQWLRRATAALAVIIASAWSLFCGALALLAFVFSRNWGFKVHRLWGRGCCWLIGIKVNFEGLENLPDRGVLAPNHESLYDIVVLASLPIDFRWISKDSVRRIPFIGWTMIAMGCFFVKRDKSGHDLNVMKHVEDALHDGAVVVIFPEGTRSRSGELLPFKKGAFKTAVNAGVPLIPVAIKGTYSIAPPGKLPQKRGHRVTVTIGKPFSTSHRPPLLELMGEFRGRMTQLIEPTTARQL